jgi:hypothetical protein
MARKRLKTMDDVRVFLSYLINETMAGSIDQNMAGKLGYLSNILRAVIADSDLEARIEQLEKEAAKK